MKTIRVHNPAGLPTIEYTKLRDLQGDFKKLSRESLLKLRNSIKNKGIFIPKFVWIDKGEYYIIDGHQTIKALKSLEEDGYIIPPIPYIEVKARNKQEAVEKLLIINSRYGKINKDTNLLEFYNIGVENIRDVIEIPEININISIPTIGDDRIPEVRERIVGEGDLIELNEHRLLCGDASKTEKVNRLMNGEKADLLITDPPYGVSYSSKNEFLNKYDAGNRIQEPIRGDDLKVIEIGTLWRESFSNIRKYMRDDASYYVFTPQGGELLYSIIRALKESGFTIKHTLVWVKNNHVLGRADYNYRHEQILYGWTKKHKFFGGGEQKTSVWFYDKPLKNKLHPTMKPVSLIVNAILNSTGREGDIVVDVFAGSGTTLIACEKTGRRCRLMEIDPLYCDVIVSRYIDFCKENGIKYTIKKNGMVINEELL